MSAGPAVRTEAARRVGFAGFDDFLHRCGEGLWREPPAASRRPNGDHRFEPAAPPPADAPPPRAAAVLVPVVERADEPVVILTQRTATLRTHSGQIAFPGGKIDAADSSPLDAALREAEEEIGLDRRFVRHLGYADPYLSGTNFLVVPAVGLVSPGYELRPNPGEVADVFEVPLAFLMDEVNHEVHSREFRGRDRQYYAMPFAERYIWGLTAGILRNLFERLYAAGAATAGDAA